jgi:beta-lactamase class A
MSVRDAAVLMIIISDNSATNMVIDLVGLERVNETMRAFGLPQTTIFQRLGDRKAGLDPRKMSVSTAAEMTGLLEMIDRHEAVSPEASEDMLRIMRRQDYRHELSRLLPWNEMNMLENHRENWVAEKGGSFLNGIRTSGAVFNSPRGSFVMAAFCEGGTGPGTGRESEGNRLNGDLLVQRPRPAYEREGYFAGRRGSSGMINHIRKYMNDSGTTAVKNAATM